MLSVLAGGRRSTLAAQLTPAPRRASDPRNTWPRQTRDHSELLGWLMGAITAENVTAGIASAALVAYLRPLQHGVYRDTIRALQPFMAYGRTIMSRQRLVDRSLQ